MKHILIIRPDSIGDGVLASAMLPYIYYHYPDARIYILCQTFVASLYVGCPYVAQVIAFDKQRFAADAEYKEHLYVQLRALNITHIFNTVFSRELLMDQIVRALNVQQSVAFRVSKRRGKYDFAFRYNWSYTKLIEPLQGWRSELSRGQEFLSALGITSDNLQPIVWVRDQDRAWADSIIEQYALQNKKIIILFAGAQYACRLYDYYGVALHAVIGNDKNYVVIALGSERDAVVTERNLALLQCTTINLCGITSLLQSAALMERAWFGIGAETGLAHIACAVGLRHCIILGGGHAGRFMPYSPLTTCVVLPLACFGCDWRCKYAVVYCVKAVKASVLARALAYEISHPMGNKPRVFAQLGYSQAQGGPQQTDVQHWLPEVEWIDVE